MTSLAKRIRSNRFLLLAALYPSLLGSLLALRFVFFLWALFVYENVAGSRPDTLFALSDFLLNSFKVLVFPGRLIRELMGGSDLWMKPGAISHYSLGDYLSAFWLSSAVWCLALASFALVRRLVSRWRDSG